jgi:hypothetical protein
MKRLCIFAATVAMIFCGNVADAQQRGGKDKNASSQSDGQGREQQRGGGQRGGGQKGGGQKGGGLFRLLDLDRDGNLSAKEIDGAVAALMKLDANKDGLLDAKELAVSGGGGGQRGQQGGQGGGKGGKNKGSQNKSAKNGN